MRKMNTSDNLYISFPIVWDGDFIKENAIVFYNPNRWGWERFWKDVTIEINKRPVMTILPCAIRAIVWATLKG